MTEEEEDTMIQSIFAIRVINGEERGIFSREVPVEEGQDTTRSGEDSVGEEKERPKEPAEDKTTFEKLVRDLWEAVGYLPVVICDSTGRQKEALELGWRIIPVAVL